MNVNYVLLKAHPYLKDLPFANKEHITAEEQQAHDAFLATKTKQLADFYNKFGFIQTGLPELHHMVLNLMEWQHGMKPCGHAAYC